MSKLKISAILLAGCMISSAMLAGCGGSKNNDSAGSTQTSSTQTSAASSDNKSADLPEDGGFKTVEYKSSNDKYRTFYEIFPYSYYDSDGNGKGDLNGITMKLDYLNDGDPKTTDDLGIASVNVAATTLTMPAHNANVTATFKTAPAGGSGSSSAGGP